MANSLGGLWSLWLALDRPERVRSVQRSLTMMGHPVDLSGRLTPEFIDLCVLGANLPGAASSFRSLLWRVLRLRGARPDCALGSGSLRSVQHQPLVAWGSHDAFGNADAARRFAEATGAELAFVGRGHLPWLDEPAQAATLVQAHLDRIVARHKPGGSVPARAAVMVLLIPGWE